MSVACKPVAGQWLVPAGVPYAVHGRRQADGGPDASGAACRWGLMQQQPLAAIHSTPERGTFGCDAMKRNGGRQLASCENRVEPVGGGPLERCYHASDLLDRACGCVGLQVQRWSKSKDAPFQRPMFSVLWRGAGKASPSGCVTPEFALKRTQRIVGEAVGSHPVGGTS